MIITVKGEFRLRKTHKNETAKKVQSASKALKKKKWTLEKHTHTHTHTIAATARKKREKGNEGKEKKKGISFTFSREAKDK